MTYDAEGVIKRKREDGRRERSEEKEEPRTRRSRGEETTIIQEEERENTVAGEQSTKGEPTFTQDLKGEEDTASKVIETEGETRKSGRLEDRKNKWATPNPPEEKLGDHLRAGRAPGGTWPSQVRLYPAWQTLSGWLTGKRGRWGEKREDGEVSLKEGHRPAERGETPLLNPRTGTPPEKP
ncbi:hypothetical protein NDU88_006819 [Pleurodeles waltl]|uniref:Uncharacterized protein n=1 Tax=Pleurodeles waltl TaxID=8319 RepID=A0AAV7MG31_PLEWA|nr:hypothetical protein NDU88_006819 [Pleurodeles waltl]